MGSGWRSGDGSGLGEARKSSLYPSSSRSGDEAGGTDGASAFGSGMRSTLIRSEAGVGGFPRADWAGNEVDGGIGDSEVGAGSGGGTREDGAYSDFARAEAL